MLGLKNTGFCTWCGTVGCVCVCVKGGRGSLMNTGFCLGVCENACLSVFLVELAQQSACNGGRMQCRHTSLSAYDCMHGPPRDARQASSPPPK